MVDEPCVELGAGGENRRFLLAERLPEHDENFSIYIRQYYLPCLVPLPEATGWKSSSSLSTKEMTSGDESRLRCAGLTTGCVRCRLT